MRISYLLRSSGKRRWLIHCSTSRRLRDISNLLRENHHTKKKETSQRSSKLWWNMYKFKKVNQWWNIYKFKTVKSMIYIYIFFFFQLELLTSINETLNINVYNRDTRIINHLLHVTSTMELKNKWKNVCPV